MTSIMKPNIERMEGLYNYCKGLPTATNVYTKTSETPHIFCMGVWLDQSEDGCETTACFAGWTVELYGTHEKLKEFIGAYGNTDGYVYYAGGLLGLQCETARELFLYCDDDKSTEDALAELKRLINWYKEQD